MLHAHKNFFLDRFCAPNAIITLTTTTILRKNFQGLFADVNININK